jgi:choline dehydrogenase-like flavoprotein
MNGSDRNEDMKHYTLSREIPLESSYDVVVAGGTPAGITAAIAAAREGASVLLLERSEHIGGLPANGLGVTDIKTRAATGGLFRQFVGRVRAHYETTLGPDAAALRDCRDGYRFEPSVAENILEGMLAEHPGIVVRRRRQFDALPERVTREGTRLREIRVVDRDTGRLEAYAGHTFIDATYEGDLAGAAGVPFRLGRESRDEHGEPMAGRIYKLWQGEVGEGSTGEADAAIQAYNYRLCLIADPARRVPVSKPAGYHRADYASLVDDVCLGRAPVPPGRPPTGPVATPSPRDCGTTPSA